MYLALTSRTDNMRHSRQLSLAATATSPFRYPDLRDWLHVGHLAWFILDVVDQLDLEPFLRSIGPTAWPSRLRPKTLLSVLLHAHAVGVRSSRQIERRCTEDLAFRVLAGNSSPDHVTIARFRVRHEAALAELLVQSVRLCSAAGLIRLGLIALDDTKVAANKVNRTLDKVKTEVAEILREAAEADQREDRQHGQARGDELPTALANPTGRLARLRQAKARLEADVAERQHHYQQQVAELAAAARAKAGSHGRISNPAARTRRPTQGRRQHDRPRQPRPAHPQRHHAGL
jgi:transposase